MSLCTQGHPDGMTVRAEVAIVGARGLEPPTPRSQTVKTAVGTGGCMVRCLGYATGAAVGVTMRSVVD
jgi:hypothetical protein